MKYKNLKERKDFFPSPFYNEWLKQFKVIEIPLSISDLSQRELSREHIAMLFEDASRVLSDDIFKYYEENGFINCKKHSKSTPFNTDYSLFACIPIITPVEVQTLLSRIGELEHENEMLRRNQTGLFIPKEE